MADPPDWGYQLSPTVQWIAARGLATSAQPPRKPIGAHDWRNILAETTRHRLEGLAIAAVAERDLTLEDDDLAALGQLELELVRQRRDYETRIGGILEMLDAARVPVRILKGLAVARLDYPDEMWRLTGDLDIAVPATHLHTAIDALLAAGGDWIDPEPTAEWITLVGKGATVLLPDPAMEVDLHRILVWGPFGVRPGPDALWGPPRHLTIAGQPRDTLGTEETLLHACAHQLILGVTRAREARDVAQMCTNPALDADRALALAHDWGAQALLATAIRLSERELALTPGAHPLSAWAAAYRVTARERLWLRAGTPDAAYRIRGIEQLAVSIELGYGRRPGRWHARRVLVRANLFPRPDTYASPTQRLRTLTRRLRQRGRT